MKVSDRGEDLKRLYPEVEMTQGPLAEDAEIAQMSPAVPGEAVEYIHIPARGFMTGRLVKKGQVLRLINLKGTQCCDTIIWDANNLYNVLSCCYTMLFNNKWDKWRPGDRIYSKLGDVLAIFSEDTTPGTHAAAGAFCSEAYWRVMFGVPGAPNCHDNLVAAMGAYNFSRKDIDWGSCFTFFMPMNYNPDGTMSITPIKDNCKPGDYVDLMAEMDIIVAISNCPSERTPLQDYNPTSTLAVIFDPNEEYKKRVEKLSKSSQ